MLSGNAFCPCVWRFVCDSKSYKTHIYFIRTNIIDETENNNLSKEIRIIYRNVNPKQNGHTISILDTHTKKFLIFIAKLFIDSHHSSFIYQTINTKKNHTTTTTQKHIQLQIRIVSVKSIYTIINVHTKQTPLQLLSPFHKFCTLKKQIYLNN